jgi:hypothetical protein
VVQEVAPAARLLDYTFDTCTYTAAAWLALHERRVRENPGAIFSESVGRCDRLAGAVHAHNEADIYEHAAAPAQTWVVFALDPVINSVVWPGDRPL